MENLEAQFRKFIYTGVGFISLSLEKFKKKIDELVKDNKISKDEGEKIMKKFFKDAKKRKKKYQEKIKDVVKKTGEGMKLVKAEEVEKLSKRIEKLEKKMAKM